MTILNDLKWRYATKKFDPSKKINQKDWEIIEEALILTPSSFGLQPWKFIVVNDRDIRQKLQPFTWNQTQVTDASHYVVFAAKKHITEEYISHFISRIAEVRNIDSSSLDMYKSMMISSIITSINPNSPIVNVQEWMSRQAYIALGSIMTVAASLKIDTCPIEGISDIKQYHDILGLSDKEWQILATCAFGYRAQDDDYAIKPKVRFEKEEVIQYI